MPATAAKPYEMKALGEGVDATAPDGTAVRLLLRLAGGSLALRQFEGQEHAAADFKRVFDGLEAGGIGLPFVVAEVTVGGAGGLSVQQ